VSDLFRLLTDEPAPPSRLGVDDALAAGRSWVRRRRLVTVAAAAVVVALVLGGVAIAANGGARQTRPAYPPSSPAPSCTVARLAAARPDNATIIVAAADPSGRYVVGEANEPAGVVLWTDGVPANITTDTAVRVWAVNRSGTMVGEQTVGGMDSRPVVYRNGHFAVLPVPAGVDSAVARAINTRGDIVGTAVLANRTTHAMRWPAGDTAAGIVLPGGTQSSAAAGIGDDGTVVGHIDDLAQPYLWHPDGRGEPLPVPAGKPGGSANGISGDWAYGTVDFLAHSTVSANTGLRRATSLSPSARWNLRTMQVDELPQLAAYGVAANGTIVGAMTTEKGWQLLGPARWHNNMLEPLPTLSPDRDRVGQMHITADARTIVGGSGGGGTGQMPTIWHC
jgi:uncharacterized membrane protein